MQKRHVIGTIQSKVVSENGHLEFAIRTLNVIRRGGLMIGTTADINAVTWTPCPLRKGMQIEATGYLVSRTYTEKVLMIENLSVVDAPHVCRRRITNERH